MREVKSIVHDFNHNLRYSVILNNYIVSQQVIHLFCGILRY